MNVIPVWLLDIDGVVNAVTADPDDGAWPTSQWVRAEATCAGARWPLLAALPVLDFIRGVHAERRAEIRWHTTWQHEAAGVSAALRLPDFPVQPCPERGDQLVGGAAPRGARWWKLPAAERVVAEETRPLLWTDDDADTQLGLGGVEAEHPLGRGEPTLIICPRMDHGLTARDLDRIDAFLGDVGPSDRTMGGRADVVARGRRPATPAGHRRIARRSALRHP